VLAPASAGWVSRERETDRCDNAVGPNEAPFPMKGMILFGTGLGIVFLASAVQTFGTNWLGQTCPYPGPCFHPEWLAMGIGLSAAAYIAWKADRGRR
jgi:hypothetical protein